MYISIHYFCQALEEFVLPAVFFVDNKFPTGNSQVRNVNFI